MLRGYRSFTFSLEEGELKDCMRENRGEHAGTTPNEEVSQNRAADVVLGGAGISVPAARTTVHQATLIRALAFCLYIAASARPTSSFISSPEAYAARPIEASTRSLRVPLFPGTE